MVENSRALPQDLEFLNSRLMAEGSVRAQWTFKAGISAMFSARGTIECDDGSIAILKAFYKDTYDLDGELINNINNVALH